MNELVKPRPYNPDKSSAIDEISASSRQSVRKSLRPDLGAGFGGHPADSIVGPAAGKGYDAGRDGAPVGQRALADLLRVEITHPRTMNDRFKGKILDSSTDKESKTLPAGLLSRISMEIGHIGDETINPETLSELAQLTAVIVTDQPKLSDADIWVMLARSLDEAGIKLPDRMRPHQLGIIQAVVTTSTIVTHDFMNPVESIEQPSFTTEVVA